MSKSKMTKGQRIWNLFVKIILSLILIYLFPWLEYPYKLLWFQYAPLILALGFCVFAQLPNLLKMIGIIPGDVIIYEDSEEMRRLITPSYLKSPSILRTVIYYIWELIIILTQLIILVLQCINSLKMDYEFIPTLICGILMSLVAYTVLTGQAYGTTTKYKRNRMWSKPLNPVSGMEYVPGVNLYRDKNGNYYNHKGTAVPAKMSKSKK